MAFLLGRNLCEGQRAGMAGLWRLTTLCCTVVSRLWVLHQGGISSVVQVPKLTFESAAGGKWVVYIAARSGIVLFFCHNICIFQSHAPPPSCTDRAVRYCQYRLQYYRRRSRRFRRSVFSSPALLKMAPWEDFDSIFQFNKDFSYDGKLIEQIISNRRALEDRLFADRLLGLLGVKAGSSLCSSRLETRTMD